MGQLIACATGEGILIASDSRAVFFEPHGEERFITMDRLVPLSSHVVLSSAGALESHDLVKDFASFAKGENLTDLNALIEAAIPFFTGRYDDILRKMCEKLPPDPIVNLYLVLASYQPKTPDPAHLFIIWDRPQPPRIEYNREAKIFTLPRRLGLEYKLAQLVREQAPLAQVVSASRAEMEKLAAQDEYIGPPFKFLTITASGIAEV
jgi:hypothetical protein